jgi:iron complex outermembrane recepter protein
LTRTPFAVAEEIVVHLDNRVLLSQLRTAYSWLLKLKKKTFGDVFLLDAHRVQSFSKMTFGRFTVSLALPGKADAAVRGVTVACLSLVLLLDADAVQAQGNVLEEVIVTAQKRAENVQDIPVTINVVTGETLDTFNIRSTNDLANSVPGLVIQETPQNLSQITVRGLGTGAAGESLDQSVGLFIDGIWAGRLREFQAALFDVERVEVIKGTQSTLLGKNTSLGAISILSRRPDDTFGGYIEGDFELEYESAYATGAVNIPTEYGNYRLAINLVDEKGYVDNKSTGNTVPEREQGTVRLSAAYDVGDDGRFLLGYLYDDLKIHGDTFAPDNDAVGFFAAMDPSANVGIDKTKNAWTSYSGSGDAEDKQKSHRAYIQYDHDIAEYQLTALTGWSKYNNDRLTDSDFLSVDYLNTEFESDYEQLTQEFRLTSPTGDRFEYIAGLFLLYSDMDYSSLLDSQFPPQYSLMGFPLDGASLKTFDQDTRVWSLFGQGAWHITQRWRATFGLRYTDEEKQVNWARSRLRTGIPGSGFLADLLAPVVPSTKMHRNEDNLDGSINIQYDLNESAMGYLSWARGSKSGGFTTEVAYPDDAEYDTEEADTTEVGVKMSIAGGAALLNASVFYTDIENFQVVSFVGTAFVTETVPADSQGVELEAAWAVTEQLVLSASATYADAQEKEVNERLPYAPEWAFSINTHYEYRWQNAPLLWRLDSAVNYRDKQYMGMGELNEDGALTLLDLRIALASANDTWEVAVLGRNLLDQKTSFSFDFPGFGGVEVPTGSTTIGSLNRPLTIALQARYNF